MFQWEIWRGDFFAERMVSSSIVEIEKFNGWSFELLNLGMENLMVHKEQLVVVDLGTNLTTTLI